MSNAPLATLQSSITIAITVADRHASAKWYADTLGFELMYHADDAGWSELLTKTEGVTLGLSEHGEPKAGTTVPVFGIADLANARKAMEDKGIRFDGPTEEIPEMVRTATFFDPDDNAMMLAETLSAA